MKPILTQEEKKRQFTIDISIVLLSLLVIACVIWSLRNLALGTHDDILDVLDIRNSTLLGYLSDVISKTLMRGRISLVQLLARIPFYFVLKSNNQLLYSAITYIPIIINVLFFGYIIGKRINKYLGFLIPVFFFTLVQVDSNHNLMVSYPMFFQIGFFMFLVGLEIFLKYSEKKKERYLWISALFMFDSLSAYESFVLYFLVFAIIALFRNYSIVNDKKRLNIKKLFWEIKYHLAAIIIYLVFYMICRKLGNINYDGATIASEFNLFTILKTMFTFSFSLFPLSEFFRSGALGSFTWSVVGIRIIVKAIVATIAVGLVLLKSEKIKLRWLLYIVIISFIACVVYCIPHAITPKYQDWVVNRGVTGFVPSFFCYFWIVLVLCAIGIYLCNLNKKLKIFIVAVLSILMFFGSIFTDYSNITTIESKGSDTIRYKMFDRMCASSFYGELEDDAAIYVEGYSGIHNNIQTLGEYGETYCGKKYHYSKDINDVMKYNHKYFMWYDFGTQSIYLARMTDRDIGNEVFILSYSDSESLNTFYANKVPIISLVYLNGTLEGNFDFSIILPVKSQKNGICITSDNIFLNSCKITNNNQVKDIEPSDSIYGQSISLSQETPYVWFGDGWLPKEDWGRWSNEKNSSLLIILPDTNGKSVQVNMDANVLHQAGGLGVKISCDNEVLYQNNIMNSGTISFIIPNRCIDKCHADLEIDIANPKSPADLGLSTDARELGIGVKDITIGLK